jgi:tRNA G37 N-methylase TrmD
VPDVLLSGDHGKIARWRFLEGERLTRERDRRERSDEDAADL